MNDIFVLYKKTDATSDVVTKFNNELTTKLKDKAIKYYDDVFAEENYYESSKSSVLLCLVDDELFYDPQCRSIWSAFWNRQRSMKQQIIYPALIKNFDIGNFGDSSPKKDMFENARRMGFYNLQEPDELYSHMQDSLEDIDKHSYYSDLAFNQDGETNVHPVWEIPDALLEEFVGTSRHENQSDRISRLRTLSDKLEPLLKEEYKRVDNRKYKDKEDLLPVCVIYTGGTAGMIHNPEDKDALDLIQADLYHLVNKLPRLKREMFEIDFYSFQSPIDSSNITSDHWLVMASVIFKLKDLYQGFVVIHGTNTMAYTSAALSYLLDNVDKPVILTGAELALTELNNDAEQNIQRSIEIAAHHSRKEQNVRDVCVLFGRRLIRGNRATKQIALDTTEGFYSPNYPELASVSYDRVVIDTGRLRVMDTTEQADGVSSIKMNYFMATEPKIVICDIYPDMDIDMFRQMCQGRDVGAVIIRTYGTGGVPSESKQFIECLKELQDKNTIVLNLTQCPKGNVELRVFETNATLFNLGVISGGDMVTEAAYCKLKHLFSKFQFSTDDSGEEREKKVRAIKHYMMVSMRGELSMSMFIIPVYQRPTGEGRETIKIDGQDFMLYKKDNINLKRGGKLELKRGRRWAQNPATVFNNDDVDYAEDGFAKFSSDAYISSAVLRLGGVEVDEKNSGYVNDRNGKKEVTLSIGWMVAKDAQGLTEELLVDKRKYRYDHKSPEIDINIDILSKARTMLKPDSELFVAISSEDYSITIKTVNILLSTVDKR